jgi:hypothetical protein
VRCPDTVVYEHGFPRGWYTYDSKNREIIRKSGKSLDTDHICKEFSKPVEGIDVVAKYMHSYEDINTGKIMTSVEFFTVKELEHFLNVRKDRTDGILQRFVPTKTKWNQQIQAIWSPKVTMVRRRCNKHQLTDKTVSLYERCVTFNGPSYYSEDSHVAHSTSADIAAICQAVVKHFQSTEHKQISRMVLHFKIDRQNSIWLLWSNSIRIGPSKFYSRRIPLDLSPRFVVPSGTEGAERERAEWEQRLNRTDHLQKGLSHDPIFSKTLKWKAATTILPQITPRSNTTAAISPGGATTPKKKGIELLPSILPLSEVDHSDDMMVDQQSQQALKTAHLRAQCETLVNKKRAATALVNDILYSLYSLSIQPKPPILFVYSADGLDSVLSPQEIESLMETMGLFDEPTEGPGVFACRARSSRPLSYVKDSAYSLIDMLFECRLMEQLGSAPSSDVEVCRQFMLPTSLLALGDTSSNTTFLCPVPPANQRDVTRSGAPRSIK